MGFNLAICVNQSRSVYWLPMLVPPSFEQVVLLVGVGDMISRATTVGLVDAFKVVQGAHDALGGSILWGFLVCALFDDTHAGSIF